MRCSSTATMRMTEVSEEVAGIVVGSATLTDRGASCCFCIALRSGVTASDSDAIQLSGRRSPQVWIASLCSQCRRRRFAFSASASRRSCRKVSPVGPDGDPLSSEPARPHAPARPAAAGSPRNGLAEVVEVVKTALSFVRLNDIHQIRNAVVDAQARAGTAHVGAHPTWREQQQRARVVAMTGGETPHQGVEGGLAGPIDLVAAGLVVADAPLTGRHDGDGAVGGTRSWNASTTRIGLSALVTMTRTNSSVETSAMVSRSSFLTPALTNSRSNRSDARRPCRAAT